MEQKKNLTNEKMGEKFKSQFELVDHAIKVVNNLVKSGRAPRIKIEIQNPAVIALEEINQGRDVFEDIPVMTVHEQVTYAFQAARESDAAPKPEKVPEKKKRRII